MELKPGDWVRVRGMRRIYEVEAVLQPRDNRAFVKLVGKKFIQPVSSLVEMRRTVDAYHAKLGPVVK